MVPSKVQPELPWAEGTPPTSPRRLEAWTPEDWPLAEGWQPVVADFLAGAQGQRLTDFLRARLAAGAVIYPPHPLRALELTPLHSVHAVVLGQDPYHGPGQAEGLAFSVAGGVKHPPSLRNIFKELGSTPVSGSLVPWARRGVLLLNACLTVEEGQPASHARKGWEALTDRLLARVAATASPCVYLLWGAHAQAKAPLIEATARQHGREILVLQANHPSPLSANRPPVPFLGSGCFRQAREWLGARGIQGVF
jgi:uracil-DNA glycosylase